MVLGLDVLRKVECTGYALGFMSLDKEVSLPTRGEGAMASSSPPGSHTACSAPPPPGPPVTSDDWALQSEREIPGRMRRLQDFAVGPLRLELNGYVRRAQ